MARPWHWSRKLFVTLVLVVGALALGWWWMLRMPGKSFSGPFDPLVSEEHEIEASLRRDVTALAGDIGERSVHRGGGLAAAADYIDKALASAGYAPTRQPYTVRGMACDNVEVTRPGGDLAREIVVIGAHYDSVAGTVGANDNASGVAALLSLARRFARVSSRRTLRFVAFANEEPPYFQTEEMGSLVYARAAKARGDDIVAMISLETLGYYSDDAGSQKYPPPLGLAYPSTGNFVGFVGDTASRDLVRRVVGSFRQHARFPSEGAAVPGLLPGIGWSDHWAFWQAGYPAVMVTDTAPFRYPHYHTREDTPDKLKYDRLARVVVGIARVIEDLVR